MTDEQILHRLLVVFAKLQEDFQSVRIVVQAIAETHPNRAALLARLGELTALLKETDSGQPLTDEEIEKRQKAIARWRRWIEAAPPPKP